MAASTGALPRLVNWLVGIPERIPVRHRRVYSVSVFCSLISIAAHVVYIFWFGSLGIRVMFAYNFVSVVAFTIVYVLGRREAYVAGCLIGVVEFIVHQGLSIVCLGWDAGLQYYLLVTIVVPFVMVPSEKIRPAIGISLLSAFAFMGFRFFLKHVEPLYSIPSSAIDGLEQMTFAVMVIGLFAISFLFVHFVKTAEDKADREFERAEGLLHNILPTPIAERLKADPTAIADGFECVSVLFADIVDFTVMSEKMTPEQVVALLNDLFSRFDLVAERHGLEKIKTIGDAYMVASGIPERNDCHAQPIMEFALEAQEEIRAFNEERGAAIRMRMGINSGPVVAGVNGRKKFIYDLWGDAVNTASRMESHGLPGRIQVTEESYRILKDEYDFEDRGEIEVKGKGRIRTYLLVGRKAVAA